MKGSESGKISIVVGTYEKTLHGYELEISKHGPSLNRIFAFVTNHLGCIKTVRLDSSSKWLVSGSTDETIRVYNMKKRQEVGSLVHHEGFVSCADFFGTTNFISGGEEGSIAIWRRRNQEWELVKPMKGHKLGINSVSIHPSGKLALSCSRDRSMRLWNLVNGRAAFDQKLSYEAEIIQWSPSGTYYAICSHNTIRFFDSKGPKLTEVEYPQYKHILAFTFLTDTIVAAGGEDRQINIWDISSPSLKNPPKVLHTLEGFDNRVKGLAVAPKPSGKYPYLVSISSDGSLKVWDLDMSSTEPLCETQISGRLVCVTAAAVGTEEPQSKGVKRKRQQKEDASEESPDDDEDDAEDDEDEDEDEGEPKALRKGKQVSSNESDEESEDEDEQSSEEQPNPVIKHKQQPKQQQPQKQNQENKPKAQQQQLKQQTKQPPKPQGTKQAQQKQDRQSKQTQPNKQTKQSPNKQSPNKGRRPQQNQGKQNYNQKGGKQSKQQGQRPAKKRRVSK